MARSPNCTGAPLFKGRVDVTISYPDPDCEKFDDNPLALPSSEPTDAQVSYTVASKHMPVWSHELNHVKTAVLYAAGRNNSASSAKVYYRVLKNGANVATGSGNSIPAGYLYSGSFPLFFDVQSGDVLSCKLWAEGFDLRRTGVYVYPTRIKAGTPIVADFSLEWNAQGFMYGEQTAGMFSYWACCPSISNTPIAEYYNAFAKWLARYSHPQWGLISTWVGDQDKGATISASGATTYHAFQSPRITRISYTPLNLRV